MRREYFTCSIEEFLNLPTISVLGQLLANDEFETSEQQKSAWEKEISILQSELAFVRQGDIAFEYSIPRMGHRIDVVLIILGIIFVVEFKIGDREYRKTTADQVMDYALDLKYFHEESRNRIIIPISLPSEAPACKIELIPQEDKVFEVVSCNKHTLHNVISMATINYHDDPLDMFCWLHSRYAPTPTIIEAAQALYRNHSVLDISRNDAGAVNLSLTTSAINRIIDDCKRNHKKAICFVTGVPGAGKTLAGLNIANERHRFEAEEHAVFLSGNGPLVDVLQEALAQDRVNQTGITKAQAKRETKAFIQIIHRFRDEALVRDDPPLEKVAIFDEAQRAWDRDSLTNFMERKKGVPGFNQSEPEFLISIMDRHQDWAVIVCLVGGGQEIYTGEAGIADWFRALNNRYMYWSIFMSSKMTESEYINDTSVEALLGGRPYKIEDSLHLGVSLRSFRSEKLASFVKALLDNKPEEAKDLYLKLSENYPIVMTRDFNRAKSWVRKKARGHERYGLLASSEGKRLRAEGIWVLTEINHVGWFLQGKDNVDSSFYLEIAASEFKVQGLELDYGILAWDADLRRTEGGFDFYKFRGTRWNHINIPQRQRYLINAYRVLLTRARQGLVVFVPRGVVRDEDPSRDSVYYDSIAAYLLECGIQEI